MEKAKINLGKVSITPAGIWDRDKTYERLDVVYCKQSDSSFIAKLDVPARVDISNEKYWQVFNAVTREAFNEFRKELDEYKNNVNELFNSFITNANKDFNIFKVSVNKEISIIDNKVEDLNKQVEYIDSKLDTINNNTNGEEINKLNIRINDLSSEVSSIGNYIMSDLGITFAQINNKINAINATLSQINTDNIVYIHINE